MNGESFRGFGDAEIRRLVEGYMAGTVSEDEMTDFLRTVLTRGLTYEDTLALTTAMVDSGSTIDLSDKFEHTADKHSTGGVGDKVTLVAVPVAVAAGVRVLKLSGRSLGHTGGTVDKLESIPGFEVDRALDSLIAQVGTVGGAMAAQTSDLVPADRSIYALRDRTRTVSSIPLIAASIMCKKVAVGAKCIVIDVKYGSGAFMKTASDARRLADTMTALGRDLGKEISCLLTEQEVPLGMTIGNALEVGEALSVLEGGGPADVVELSADVAAEMIHGSGRAQTKGQALILARRALDDGSALTALDAIVAAQGGSLELFMESLSSEGMLEVGALSPATGFLRFADSSKVGVAAQILSGGRRDDGRVEEPRAGLILKLSEGDRVEKGETWAVMRGREAADFKLAEQILSEAIEVRSH